MVSAKKFYKLANQHLKTIAKETCKVFSIDTLDIQIIQRDVRISTPGYSSGILCYDFFKTKNLIFFPTEFIIQYPQLKKKISKFQKNFSLENYVVESLSHEVPHKGHDLKSNFEMGEELKELALSYDENDESKVRYTACIGIIDGVVDYARDIILKRLRLDEIIDANKKYTEDYIERGMKGSENTEPQDIPNIVKKVPFDSNKIFEVLILEHYKQKFEKEGLESFRRFATEWGPSQVSYDDATSLLIELFRQQQLRMYQRIR